MMNLRAEQSGHNATMSTEPAQLDKHALFAADMGDITTENGLSSAAFPSAVQPQESDLRGEVTPATQQQADEARAQKHNLDVMADDALGSRHNSLQEMALTSEAVEHAPVLVSAQATASKEAEPTHLPANLIAINQPDDEMTDVMLPALEAPAREDLFPVAVGERVLLSASIPAEEVTFPRAPPMEQSEEAGLVKASAAQNGTLDLNGIHGEGRGPAEQSKEAEDVDINPIESAYIPKALPSQHSSADQGTLQANETVDQDPQFDETNSTQDPSQFNELNSAVQSTKIAESHSTPMVDQAEPAPLDTDMALTPGSPSKGRGREEDGEEERSAKRTKVENEEPGANATTPVDQSKGSTPLTPTAGSTVPEARDDVPMTEHQLRELPKLIRAQKNTKAGRNFRDSVANLWPTLSAQYNERIANPVDLGMMERRIANNEYATVGDVKADFQLLYENTLLYNGANHEVTSAAQAVRDGLLAKFPPVEAPAKVAAKGKSFLKPGSLPRVFTKRRTSSSAPKAPANGTGRAAAAPSQTFAVGPEGIPLIRRDSTKTGTRPKREIHPPKSKDLQYNNRPKKKKFAAEMKFCERVLSELAKPKHLAYNYPFQVPVDPVALGIPGYFATIKTPMDVSTIRARLTSGHYERARDFEEDFRLMLRNCFKFNAPPNPIYDLGKQFEAAFDAEWRQKGEYLAEHGDAGVTSPASEADSDEGESEEEESEADEATAETPVTSAFAARLIEEQTKLIELMSDKKPDQQMIQLQQNVVSMIKAQVEAEAAKAGKTAAATKRKSKGGQGGRGGKKAKGRKASGQRKGGNAGGGGGGGGDGGGRVMSVEDKEVISNNIGTLDEASLATAIGILRRELPDLNPDGPEEEMEFDIDQFSQGTLAQLHELIVRVHPELRRPAKSGGTAVGGAGRGEKAARPRKNKPMSKSEQEAKIAQLRASTQEYEQVVGRGGVRACEYEGRGGGRELTSAAVEERVSSEDEESTDSEED
jgi:bromodomain-containing factor 1